jgi:hypothetical protein
VREPFKPHRSDNVPGTLYLLHFSRPLGDPKRPRMAARHYLGWTNGVAVDQRLADHRAGRGAAITRAAVGRGIELQLVATWPGTRNDERRAKRSGNFARRCPTCTGAPMAPG